MRSRWVLVPMSALVAACGTLLGVQSDDGSNPPPPSDDATVDGERDDAPGDGGSSTMDAPPGDARLDAPKEAGPPRPLHVFVTSGAYMTGAMLMGSAADDACNTAAANARLDGGPSGFVAWLSTQAKDAKDKVKGVGPFVDTHDGGTIASNRVVLLGGNLESSIRFTEDGSPIQGQVAVWTGTKPNGTWSGDSCGAWDNVNGTELDSEGQTGDATSAWTYRGAGAAYNDCLANPGLHLYCFEQP
ncbi:MAG TPA: hypothetical protein VIF62_20555 [Labilithrix sp.]